MHLARHDWAAGQGARLSNLLNAVSPELGRPDFRGWEWYYLLSQVHGERFAFPGQVGPIAWSPDGKSLATCDKTGLIKIWDIGSGELKASLKGCPGAISSIAWSPHGKRLAAAGDRRTIVIWDLTSGNKVQSLRGHTARVRCVDWNPDDVRLASLADDGTIGIWDWRSEKTLSWLRGLKRGFHYSLAWLPDGRQLLGCSGDWDHNALKVWDTETGDEVVSRRGMEAVLSPDGSRITSLSGGPLGRVEALETGELVASFNHVGRNSTTWSPDGEQFASSGSGGTIKIWDAETGAEISSILGAAGAWRLAWSPAGPLLAGSCGDANVRVWDTANVQEALTLSTGNRHALSVAFSPDGRRLLAGARWGMLKMWDVESGEKILSVQQPATTYIWSVAWSPDGERFACRSIANGVMIYDAKTGDPVPLLLACEDISGSVAWSPDGRILAVINYRGHNRKKVHVRLWDASTGREVARSGETDGHPSDGPHCSWSPDGKRLAVGKCLWVWDSASRKLREEVVLPTETVIVSLDWSPDGKYLAVGEYNRITIYDTTDWARIRVLLGHISVVSSVAWHPHMARLASGGRDGTVRIWDSSTGQELWISDAHGSGTGVAVAWSPDGLRLASAGGDCKVRIWDASAADRFLKRQEKEADTQSPTVKWGRAMQLARKGQLDETIASLKELSAETPDLPDYRLRLPGVLFDAGKQDEAIQMLQQSVAEFPETREYQNELAFLYERRATQLCRLGQFEEATGILGKLAGEFPDRPDFRAELAFQMAGADRLGETMATFDKLGEMFDGWPDYRPELARQLAASRMHAVAATIYERLGAEYPDTPEYSVLHNTELARGLFASRRDEEAIAIFRKLIQEFPDESDHRLRHELAIVYFGRADGPFHGDEFDKALSDLDEAIRLNSEFSEALDHRGRIYLEKGNLDQALADFDAAIRFGAVYKSSYRGRGETYLRKGEFSKAVADFLKAIEIEKGGKKATAGYWLALAHLAAGDIEAYRSACTRMREHFDDSKHPEEAHWLAWTCVLAPDATYDFSIPVSAARLAVRTDAESVSYLHTLGGILYRAGRFEEAVERLTEADNLIEDPDTESTSSPAYTWYFLAMAHHKLGHDGEAERWLVKATEWTDKVRAEHEEGTSTLAWNRKLTLKLLREEAEAMLDSEADESSKGPDEATTPPAAEDATR